MRGQTLVHSTCAVTILLHATIATTITPSATRISRSDFPGKTTSSSRKNGFSAMSRTVPAFLLPPCAEFHTYIQTEFHPYVQTPRRMNQKYCRSPSLRPTTNTFLRLRTDSNPRYRPQVCAYRRNVGATWVLCCASDSTNSDSVGGKMGDFSREKVKFRGKGEHDGGSAQDQIAAGRLRHGVDNVHM